MVCTVVVNMCLLGQMQRPLADRGNEGHNIPIHNRFPGYKSEKRHSEKPHIGNIFVFLKTGFVFISRVDSFPFRKQLPK